MYVLRAPVRAREPNVAFAQADQQASTIIVSWYTVVTPEVQM